MKMRRNSGFTLIELLVVVAIIGIIASVAMPEYQRWLNRAESVTCINNLRQVGVGVLTYVGENNNTYPIIEPNENDPIYKDYKTEEGTEIEVKPLLEVLAPYGVDKTVLRCPADAKGRGTHVYYTDPTYNSSYQWRILLDEENGASPKIYGGRRGPGIRVVRPSRVTLCTDFEAVHGNRLNRLYADGHVSKPF